LGGNIGMGCGNGIGLSEVGIDDLRVREAAFCEAKGLTDLGQSSISWDDAKGTIAGPCRQTDVHPPATAMTRVLQTGEGGLQRGWRICFAGRVASEMWLSCAAAEDGGRRPGGWHGCRSGAVLSGCHKGRCHHDLPQLASHCHGGLARPGLEVACGRARREGP
jgi:hypothetical protein